MVTANNDTLAPASPSASATNRRLAGKRVAMVTFSSFPQDPRPRRTIDALVEQGATIDLICLGGKDTPRREVRNGLEVLRSRINHDRGGKLQYAWRYGAFILFSSLVFAMRALVQRYDLVYVHNMPDVLVLTALIPKALGAKVVLDLHDPMPELMETIFQVPEESASVRLLKRAEKWSIARTDMAITVNIACQRIFANRSCAADKIAVVMNSPDDRIFSFQAAEPQGGRHGGEKPFVIMYHGSLVERNGLDLAVAALAQISWTVPNAELRVYGARTAFLDRAMNLAAEKNVQHKVRYLGPKRLEDLVTEIGQCDIGVIPNQSNAFTDINTPTRIFEYLALGKPAIAPSTQGITDYFDRNSLLFFRSGDAADLAQQIEYAFSHPRELSEIACRGQRVYLAHSWQREKQTLVDRVSKVLEKKL